MHPLIKDSGISTAVVVFLVAITTWLVPVPWPKRAEIALAVLFFLAIMGVRSGIRWMKRRIGKKSPSPVHGRH